MLQYVKKQYLKKVILQYYDDTVMGEKKELKIIR